MSTNARLAQLETIWPVALDRCPRCPPNPMIIIDAGEPLPPPPVCGACGRVHRPPLVVQIGHALPRED
jgi:hypothetical protein